ncbi:hypothetical protein RIF29_25862 [Crotalaria pallida]|uniref:Pulmonary surfactant-associated protein B n=1 Tax=Crotalaria pallida TaxID=3830 RepID=A0AAN9EM36_CROPI
MEEKIAGLLLFIVLGAAWSRDARHLVIANTNQWKQNRQSDVCALCEQYTAEALNYLNDKNNQNEIIETLHNTCYQLFSFKKRCIELVDYYAPLFFSQVASILPGELCKTANLCPYNGKMSSSQVQENGCAFCKDTISSLVVKLKDPDTELQIMHALLKVCNSMEKLTKNCKRLVFEYGPLVFVNAEKFLKTEEICTAIHACPATTVVSQEEIPLVSDS